MVEWCGSNAKTAVEIFMNLQTECLNGDPETWSSQRQSHGSEVTHD